MDPLAHGLLAFRHAPVALSGVCYGRLDVAAELPPEAAAAAIERALHELCVRPGVVFSSPLSRCALPAAELAARLGVPRAIDDRLLEISYGAWEGRAFADIERDDPAAYAAWLDGWERVGPPGGESALDVESRVRSIWRELGTPRGVNGVDVAAVAADADVASRARPPLLVAHAGVLRALRVVACGASWPAAMSAPVPHLTAERFPLPPSALSLADL
ncbi:histidine phosphatase family protein [Sorangium sp. So ce117]|uniref:histidine phosphatase family protein n=1 Tax=Sorangium sp. So ce117 TaxID=3133277 RepID=UPI003F62393D